MLDETVVLLREISTSNPRLLLTSHVSPKKFAGQAFNQLGQIGDYVYGVRT